MSIKQALGISAVFQGVAEEDLELVVPMCLEEVATKDATILKQGEPGRSLYLVSEGRVALYMTLERPDGSSSGPKTVASIDPREAFGWSALVQPHESTVSATAVETSRLIVLESSALLELLSKHGDMGYLVMVNVATLIAERLKDTREAMVFDRSYVEYLQSLPENMRQRQSRAYV